MTPFLTLSSTYEHVEVGLYSGNTALARESIDKKLASKELVSAIGRILGAHRAHIRDIAFIAVNQGPAPFTTLRTVIATANGLNFASGIPLVGVDGFRALAYTCRNDQWPHTVYILNAFGNDAYFYVERPDADPLIGYDHIGTLLERIHAWFPHERIRFVGNGITTYADQIHASFGEHAHLAYDEPSYAPTDMIAHMGNELWHMKEGITTHILPLYLKKHACQIALEAQSQR